MHRPGHAFDTIVAVATAPVPAGVGIIRLSGPDAFAIASQLCGRALEIRHAHYVRVRDAQAQVLDDGVAIAFKAPASFTGEDVVELQLHGSPVVLEAVVACACALGARRAVAGEFSERAFLHGKLDLTQAEAIADLIEARDTQTARAARRSLEGAFSKRVDALADDILRIRVQIEASIDFVDEPIDTDGIVRIAERLAGLEQALADTLHEAQQGQKLRDGLHAALVGAPNVGKSSLLNALAGVDRAIVTDVAGTTRDVLKETVRVGGIELTLIDTAGLRVTEDVIEAEGMRRARGALKAADLIIAVVDAQEAQLGRARLRDELPPSGAVIWVINKGDLAQVQSVDAIVVSAQTGEGLDTLRAAIVEHAQRAMGEGAFTARTRHVEALVRAQQDLRNAIAECGSGHIDLCADDLRRCHDALGEITGRVTPDDLLGAVFSTFCIGK
ncbi:tRNA uridine-5-carboxymethylaminomethyl(34) synthesis GTPase MnmE [Lysobacter sp. HDW10]|uniref:tRNA uridine-5-carboxymethylaminomethyl(34) synthesis GTPase MnmE n=1 Tax=Lysobacter sp. HDW10 TaxID=2714936 RepID=UPI00140D6073|nr:tRNA uridine-5-carboxymethylaminomethyl(34) synthesis GTPase MnmE [Lysobacter sp. HDW10]QIK80760.1 tRNA uridine-5-carboxymethylaminomethyl(34) synthesis GTPase MnmE [Lysobacter sp. HDW10]